MAAQPTRHSPRHPHHQVFDVTSYLDDHPGGSESILLNAGEWRGGLASGGRSIPDLCGLDGHSANGT